MQPDGKKIKYIPSFDKQDRSSKASLTVRYAKKWRLCSVKTRHFSWLVPKIRLNLIPACSASSWYASVSLLVAVFAHERTCSYILAYEHS